MKKKKNGIIVFLIAGIAVIAGAIVLHLKGKK